MPVLEAAGEAVRHVEAAVYSPVTHALVEELLPVRGAGGWDDRAARLVREPGAVM